MASLDQTESAESHATTSLSHCLVCYSDLASLLRGKSPCDHNDICGICHLRLRHLHKDNKCPICKQENAKLIVDRSASDATDGADDIPSRFDEYSMWGDDIGPDYVYRESVGMFFPKAYYDAEILPLFGYQCHECDFDPAIASTMAKEQDGDGNDNGSNGKDGKQKQQPKRKNNSNKPKSSLAMLKDHLRTAHRKSMCQLCIDHKRDFIAKLPRMIPRVLQNHMKDGDGVLSGFNGHPLCEFCRPKRFYSLQELHTHLQKDHYRCHVCDKQGVPDQYFKHYRSLEKHFDQRHFLCRDVQCLAARFVVFTNEIDLRAHETAVHGGTSSGSNRLQLEFKTRRTAAPGGLQSANNLQEQAPDAKHDYNVDGQVFVPEALPTTQGNQTMEENQEELHPLHVQRTAELRQQAALLRGNGESTVESFPSLSDSVQPTEPAANPRLRVGWSEGAGLQRIQANRRPAGKVTEEDFPSLGPSSTAASSRRAAAGLVARGSAQHRQFAAMSLTASQPTQREAGPSFNGLSYGNAAAVAPSQQTREQNMFMAPTSPSPATNRQANLAPDNFPSLSGGTRASNRAGSSSTYSAANALAKKRGNMGSQRNPQVASTELFPSLSASSSQQTNKKAPPTRAVAATPPANSATNFPAMAQAPPSIAKTARERVMNQRQISSQQHSNILQAPVQQTQAAKATVVDMKASLGPAKFKQLKRLTKEFTEATLSPEGYIDQSAALFPAGYEDPDFWSFLPNLLESCPNEDAAMRALSYMTSLKRQQSNRSVRNRNATTATAKPVPSWSNGGGPSIQPSPTQALSSSGWSTKVGGAAAAKRAPQIQPRQRLTMPINTRSAAIPAAGKKKSAWSAGSSTATMAGARAPAGAGALSVAAATQRPQGGSATKFMANQQKQQKAQTKTTTTKKATNGQKQSKKKKAELRALAFGK